MESWRHCWQEGWEPLLSERALLALRDALARDDPRCRPGHTTFVESGFGESTAERGKLRPDRCCPLAFTGWVGEELDTVAEVEGYFAGMSGAASERLGDDPFGGRFLINWIDESPWAVVRPALLAEVDLALARRGAAAEAVA